MTEEQLKDLAIETSSKYETKQQNDIFSKMDMEYNLRIMGKAMAKADYTPFDLYCCKSNITEFSGIRIFYR